MFVYISIQTTISANRCHYRFVWQFDDFLLFLFYIIFIVFLICWSKELFGVERILHTPERKKNPEAVFWLFVHRSVFWNCETMAANKNDAVNRTIQQDWANREYIEIITGSIKKISDFLNSFGESFFFFFFFRGFFGFQFSFNLFFYTILRTPDRSCRGRIAEMNEKLTNLERTMECLEARVNKGDLSVSNPIQTST